MSHERFLREVFKNCTSRNLPSKIRFHCCRQHIFSLIVWSMFIVYEHILYRHQCNLGVAFFKMGFWVRFNLKNSSKNGLFNRKVGFYSRKKTKKGLFTLPGALFKSGVALERIRYLFSTLL